MRRAIVSVLNQTFSAFRVCVYDDASNDTTRKVVAQLAEADPRVKYYRHERNVGPAANFNYGLKRVDTPFFSVLSDDDLLLPHLFESAVHSLGANPDVMFYAGRTFQVEDNTITGISKDGGRFGYLAPPDGLLDIVDHHLQWNSIVFRSRVVECVGVLDASVGGPADMDFVFRIAARHPVIISTEPGAIYTLHTQNFYARSPDYRQYERGYNTIINRMMSDESLSLDTRIQVTNRFNAWLANALISLAERASLQGEFDTVSAIAGILARVCNKKTRSLLLVTLIKLKESSEPAFFLISWIERCLWFIFPPNVTKRVRLRQLQRRYGEYLATVMRSQGAF